MALRAWLLLVSVVVALVAAWLALRAPRLLAHLPAHERVAKHALMIVFSSVMHTIEILGDDFGYDYFNMTRALFNLMIPMPPPDPRVKIEIKVFNGVPVRIYYPNNRQTHSPAMLFIHGGTWAFFHTEQYDGPCQWFALELQAVVVSVEYRLLPEHRYPAPLDDCFVALEYLMSHASDFDIDPTRIAVAGDSAGGHLTAALSLRWRREMIEPQRKRASNSSAATSSAAAALLPPIRLQVLIYPLVQFVNTSTTSFTAHSDFLYGRSPLLRAWTWVTFPDRINDRALVRALTASSHVTRTTRERLAHYFHFGPPDGSEDEVDTLVTAEDRAHAAHVRAAEENPEGDPATEADLLPHLLNPEISPLFVDSFDDLPATYVVTCGFDAIRDDGFLYVRRLRRSGRVHVAHRHYAMHQHGFMNLIPNNELQHDLSTFLAGHHEFF